MLEQAVQRDWFASTLDTWIEDTFRTGPRAAETFYGTTLAKSGREAAEAQLMEWIQRDHRREIADSLTPIAQGMLKVMQADHRNVKVGFTTAFDRTLFPTPYKAGPHAKLISLYNPEIPGCGCNQPAGASDFGVYGRLGLQAIAVAIDPERPEANELTLVLPIRNAPAGTDGYVAVQLDRTGHSIGDQRTMNFYRGAALSSALGIMGNDSIIMYGTASGGVTDDWIGFPGAMDYIASRLPALALYLLDAAEKLSGDHKH